MAWIAWSISTQRESSQPATIDTSRPHAFNIFYSTTLRPPRCLHIAQHKVSGRLAASVYCLVIGWELSGGDRLRCWCIYLLSAVRKQFLRPDWLGLITEASIALFKEVGLGRVCLLTRWDVHEDEKKTFPNLGWHWPLGKQSTRSSRCECEATSSVTKFVGYAEVCRRLSAFFLYDIYSHMICQ